MRSLVVFFASAMMMGGVILSGCTTDSSQNDPTTRSLHDPMNYAPSFDDTDITGGNTNNFDSRGFKQDVNHVLNP